ncbi:LytR family transcriptional regulator [Streptomyces sp. RKND-216]|uniref:LCP family protein n=1 Tax=Streptomyces sp. RKND-216 TaxID=2562581 RepID=UPI00109E00BC|nr:LCP family protein [Streptomyces sp. RKND-216]THA26102.1 LytR family transcriptional regulator [Streptomyces sp. RKND-216]
MTTHTGPIGDDGTAATPAASPETTEAGPANSASRPRPSDRRRRALRWVAFGTSAALLTGAGTAWAVLRDLDGNIRTDTSTARELARHAGERPDPTAGETRNVLLLGSDSREGRNSGYGDAIGARSDTTILLHLPADRSHATAVSIPRDLMVDVPECRRSDGTTTRAQFAQFNWAFQFGGAACTIRTVERLTGVRIDHHLIVDFKGFKNIVNAVGGVEVCLPHDVHDRDASLDLEAGRQTLNGKQALGYVRARKAFDGSDTQRIGRQQDFLASLLDEVREEGVLTDPSKLYPLLDAATSALTADEGLDSLRELYGLVRSLRETPEGEVHFLTVPRQPHTLDPNRDELVQPAANQLFERLRDGEPARVTHTTTPGATPDSSPEPESPYREASDATGVCGGDGARNGGN